MAADTKAKKRSVSTASNKEHSSTMGTDTTTAKPVPRPTAQQVREALESLCWSSVYRVFDVPNQGGKLIEQHGRAVIERMQQHCQKGDPRIAKATEALQSLILWADQRFL